MASFFASLSCVAITLIVLASIAVSALCIYAIYWILGYYTDWPWFIRLIVAFVGCSMITGVFAGSTKR